MKISWTDHVTREEVFHTARGNRISLHRIKRRLSGLVTPCIRTTFYNTLLIERQKVWEDEEEDMSSY